MYISIDDISITHLVFDEDFTNAIERKQVAQQDVERVKVPIQCLHSRRGFDASLAVRCAKSRAREVGGHHSFRGRVRSCKNSDQCAHCGPGAAGAAALGSSQRDRHNPGQVAQRCFRAESWQHDLERAQAVKKEENKTGVAFVMLYLEFWFSLLVNKSQRHERQLLLHRYNVCDGRMESPLTRVATSCLPS